MSREMSTTMLPAADAGAEQELNRLAEEINTAHAAAEKAVSDGVAHARCAGELLTAVKAKVPHGEFTAWVERHCTFSVRTAQLYMRLARWCRAPENAQRVAHLSLREAARALASADRPAADERPDAAVRRLYAGTMRRVKAAVLHRQEIVDQWRAERARVLTLVTATGHPFVVKRFLPEPHRQEITALAHEMAAALARVAELGPTAYTPPGGNGGQ